MAVGFREPVSNGNPEQKVGSPHLIPGAPLLPIELPVYGATVPVLGISRSEDGAAFARAHGSK